MKNKEHYNLEHLRFENDPLTLFDGKTNNHITLIYENKPILRFYTEQTPFKAIMNWLEEDMDNY